MDSVKQGILYSKSTRISISKYSSQISKFKVSNHLPSHNRNDADVVTRNAWESSSAENWGWMFVGLFQLTVDKILNLYICMLLQLLNFLISVGFCCSLNYNGPRWNFMVINLIIFLDDQILQIQVSSNHFHFKLIVVWSTLLPSFYCIFLFLNLRSRWLGHIYRPRIIKSLVQWPSEFNFHIWLLN